MCAHCQQPGACLVCALYPLLFVESPLNSDSCAPYAASIWHLQGAPQKGHHRPHQGCLCVPSACQPSACLTCLLSPESCASHAASIRYLQGEPQEAHNQPHQSCLSAPPASSLGHALSMSHPHSLALAGIVSPLNSIFCAAQSQARVASFDSGRANHTV